MKQSLADLVGKPHVEAVCEARAALSGDDAGELLALAREPVEFLPDAFMQRQAQLLERVGEKLIETGADEPQAGATSRMFHQATSTAKAPLSAIGQYRVGEDGRLYLITKSEHYHTPLGHAFPGYELIAKARQLGIPNATHNNTRGAATRLLEEELIRAAHGLAHDDADGLARILAGNDLFSVNRVLNLETGSLAAEAALKMMLARFYRVEATNPKPEFEGRQPVFLVMGNDDGGLLANYHGTTILTQLMRGMWPDLKTGLEENGRLRVCPIRPNNLADLDAAFARWDDGDTKIAGFFHEIIMMNYGGRRLTREFLGRAYELCRQHGVPTVCDEIQSCLWHHDLFMFREWGLTPSFVAIGKGFPGGEYPASRLLFSAAMDNLPQFGALVTNGQEELAAIAYLVTMRWAQANASVTRGIGDYYEGRLRDFAAAHSDIISAVDGCRHLSTLVFSDLEAAKWFVASLSKRGLDISAQTYKADCPPVVLTKIPLISTPAVVDFIIARMEQAMAASRPTPELATA